MSRKILMPALCGMGLLLAPVALAHKPSDSFIMIKVDEQRITGQLELSLRDLELAFGIDQNGDRNISWGELKARHEEITSYALPRLKISADGRLCQNELTDKLVSSHSDGQYAAFVLNIACGDQPIANLKVEYGLLFEFDAQHRGLLNVETSDRQLSTVLTPDRRVYEVAVHDPSILAQLGAYIKEGLHHIYTGYDHMLFLVALLLPAVFLRQEKAWVARGSLRSVLVETAKVVTAFTVAHSLTLCVTTLHLIAAPPSRLTETSIAASIVFTAFNNVRPIVREKRWIIGFLFGLVHGLGFASVLTDLGLSGWSIATALVGFNIGVELAQLTVIALVLPPAFLFRRTMVYRRVIFLGGSIVTGMLALGWMVEQIAHRQFMPF